MMNDEARKKLGFDKKTKPNKSDNIETDWE